MDIDKTNIESVYEGAEPEEAEETKQLPLGGFYSAAPFPHRYPRWTPGMRFRWGPVIYGCLWCGARYESRRFGPAETHAAFTQLGLRPELLARGRGKRAEPGVYRHAADTFGRLIEQGFTQKTLAGVASLGPSTVTRMMKSQGYVRFPKAVHQLEEQRREQEWFFAHLVDEHSDLIAVYQDRKRRGFILDVEQIALIHGHGEADRYAIKSRHSEKEQARMRVAEIRQNVETLYANRARRAEIDQSDLQALRDVLRVLDESGDPTAPETWNTVDQMLAEILPTN